MFRKMSGLFVMCELAAVSMTHCVDREEEEGWVRGLKALVSVETFEDSVTALAVSTLPFPVTGGNL